MKPLQVLLVEDNAGDARLLHEMFRKEKAGSFVLTHLLRMTEAVAATRIQHSRTSRTSPALRQSSRIASAT